ncbi:unnamed protein product [Rotaria magnacalcarata]|uniref:GH18 domain-containing protein n=1 Tax=Rotaria magnacalcarata TaxID=392030 RepID=A0A8S2NPY4_9BILA|nr:unnamed protein product [Rotaria magnacalcarata]CAF4116667.1 unnamed protein product [Rotaria magnacalcarata]
MIPHCSNFVIYLWFSCVLINISIAQQYPRPRRLCVNRKNPSQYYPCALNYIGIKSWSIYQCPDQLLFDETLQKCYAKATPLSRRLDQRTLLSSLDNSLYEQINNLLRSNSIFQEEEQTTTIKPFWNDRSMNNGGVFWANGYPLMRLNNQPLFQSTPSLNSRLSYFSQQYPYPAPVSEDYSSDFHGAWQNHTGLNAPLYRRYDETADEAMFNQDFGMSIWLKNGAPAHKLVLGIPLFSRTFLLARADDHDLRSPTIGNGTEGPYTRSAGFLSYFEACVFQMDPQWKKRAVPDGSESGYMYKDRDWISYDTLENVKKRAAYVVANHFGGLFAWSLDMDDFNGAFCNNGTYPFIKNSLSLLPTHLSSYL